MLPPPDIFDPARIAPDTKAINAAILKKLSEAPDQWAFPPAVIRERRARGLGPFPLAPKSENAQTITIEGPRGPITLRIIAPAAPKGVYLHIHGGGWVLGAADQQDPRLEQIAARAGLACVSVEYRLAPEHPYPAANDDCEQAALWLVREGQRLFGTDRYVIGGESAGAHLSVVTMLRLRDRHRLMPFLGANLIAGCYDLALTPSVRNWGTEKLILNTRDVEMFVRHYLLHGGSVADPDISPMHARLEGLPPALFTIGTRDPLLDDSLFMSQRWMAAGHSAELAVYPGGCHVFTGFPGSIADKANARIDAFLAGRTG